VVTPALLALFPRVTPNQVTLIAFAVAVAAAVGFAVGAPIVAAVLVALASVLDGSDGEIARLTYRSSAYDTMTHALGLGRSQARHPSNDETTRRGLRLLEGAIAFLGVEAQPGQIARPGPR
jgi:hypothetical protein